MDILLFVVLLIFIGLMFIGTILKTATSEILPHFNDLFPYSKVSTLLTPAELSFYHVLKIAMSEQFDIYVKVRLADLISVRKGMAKSDWGRAFNKIKAKHIDFVLCDKKTSKIICAIELDDKSHSQPKRQYRDDFVDKALGAANLPFARFNAAYTYQSSEIEQDIQSLLSPAIKVSDANSSDEKILIEPDKHQQEVVNNQYEKKCPECEGILGLKTITVGKNKGHQFYACSNFPQCRHVVDAL